MSLSFESLIGFDPLNRDFLFLRGVEGETMPQITIEQGTFERLQRHARPVADTSDRVIVRALDALDEKAVKHVPKGHFAATVAEVPLNGLALPDLTHTKVLDAAIDGEPIPRPNWRRLRDEIRRRMCKLPYQLRQSGRSGAPIAVKRPWRKANLAKSQYSNMEPH